MNKTHCATLAFATFLFAGMAFAGPLVLFPTGNFAFTVDISYPAAMPTPAPDGTKPLAVNKAKKIEVAQYDKEKGLRITWTDGQVTEQWTIPNLPVVFQSFPNGVIFPVGNGSMAHNIEASNNPTNPSAFSWVTAACLAEKDPVNYKGEMCYHYLGTVNLPMVPTGHTAREMIPVKREAWIDSTTLLPVALNTGDSFCVFTYLPPPTGPLNVPDNFQKAIANYKHVMGYP